MPRSWRLLPLLLLFAAPAFAASALPGFRVDRVPLAGPQFLHLAVVPLALWLVVVLAAIIAVRGLREVLPVGEARLGAPALVFVVLLSLALRVGFGIPWPINLSEILRLPLFGSAEHFKLYAMFATPLSLVFGDPMACQGALNLGLSALAPVLAALVATAWRGPTAGLMAGVLLATSPEQIVWSRTTDAGVGLAAFALLAVLATEVFLRRPSAARALAAAALWALVIHLRPESPAFALPLALWALVSPAFRSRLREGTTWACFVLPIVAALGLDAWHSSVVGTSALGAPPSLAVYAGDVPRALWAMVLDPDLHSLAVLLLALVGIALARGPTRVFAAVVGLLFPALLVPLGGLVSVETNLRYMLFTQPFLVLAAGAAAGRVAAAAYRTDTRPAVRVAAIGLLLVAGFAPLLHWRYITTPSPIQAQHAFLAQRAVTLPEHAVLAVYANPATYDSEREHAAYRLAMAGRFNPSPMAARCADEPGVVVVSIDDLERTPPPASCPVWYLEGAFDHGAGGPAARERLERGWTVEAVVAETVWVRADPPAIIAPMELALLRLRPHPTQ